jgi:hypothetical protein
MMPQETQNDLRIPDWRSIWRLPMAHRDIDQGSLACNCTITRAVIEGIRRVKCSMKRPYSTVKSAKSAAAVGGKKRGVQLFVYKCKLCRLWHLSSQAQAQTK